MGEGTSPIGEEQTIQTPTSNSYTNMCREWPPVRRSGKILEKGEIKKMQQWIDRRYRYKWSNKKEPPLKTMQRIKHNMQDLRNSLQINTLQWKIEQRILQRIGHVMRLDNSRPVKRAMTGWLPALETIPKEKTKIRTTPHYWNRLVKEAGVNPTQIDYLTSDRKK